MKHWRAWVLKSIGRRYFRRAEAIRGPGNWAKAARLYEEGLRWHGDRPGQWLQYGHALKESGRIGPAIQAYLTAIRIDPDVAEFHFQLGLAREGLGNHIRAMKCYERALALDPAMEKAEQELRRLMQTPALRGAEPDPSIPFPFEVRELV